MKKKPINGTAECLGHALRSARQTARLLPSDAADVLGIMVDELLEYERGCTQIPTPILEHIFTVGYKMIGVRKLEKKYLAQRNFIRKIKQAIKDGA